MKMKKYLYLSIGVLCLLMLIDTTMTAYGVAGNFGMEINPIILWLWYHLPITSGLEFSLLTIALYGLAILTIAAILIHATIYAPENEKHVGKYLCIGAASSHAVLFGSVIALNLVQML